MAWGHDLNVIDKRIGVSIIYPGRCCCPSDTMGPGELHPGPSYQRWGKVLYPRFEMGGFETIETAPRSHLDALS